MCWIVVNLPSHAECSVTKALFGRLRDGEVVEAYTIRSCELSVTLLNYGGILYRIEAPDRNDKMSNVIRNLGSLAQYEQSGNFYSIIGRYAGRIGTGGFTLDGRRIQLTQEHGAAIQVNP
ncbi:MAG TPA: hypothetical protein VJU59_07075 [Paraburkholderia sp.]|nr:hypothetical protein [Paraburkholderia sp.]